MSMYKGDRTIDRKWRIIAREPASIRYPIAFPTSDAHIKIDEMPVFTTSKSLVKAFAILTSLYDATASPIARRVESIERLLGRDTFEWTALGDSYSSGVGAGDYTSHSYRCLRYKQAYPVLINGDSRLPNGNHQFNNVVCSGSSTADVNDYQFYDEDTSGKPSWQYGTF